MNSVFQPIVDLRSKTLLGFEALTRYRDGRTPLDRLQQAHVEGNHVDVELSAINNILVQSSHVPDGYLITFNASGDTIEAFAQNPQNLNDRFRWGLELLENTDPSLTRCTRQYATDLGCLLLIDDAGVAHSTAERVKDLKPDIVKFDRSLITGYTQSPAIRSAMHDLLDASAEINAKVLAEGVESPEHLQLLDKLDFDFAQGFHFGPGLPAEDLSQAIPKLSRRVGIDAPGF